MFRSSALVSLMLAALLSPAFVAAAPPEALQVVIAHGPGEKHLRQFAEQLEKEYRVEVQWIAAEKSKNNQPTPFTGLESLAKADVIVSNLYRTWAPPDELAAIKTAFTTKPVVGLRKAHHGFQNWLEADREVFGVTYKGHYFGKDVTQRFTPAGKNHELTKNVELFLPGGGLYQHLEVADDVTVLITGGPSDKPPHPQTWMRSREQAPAFYTRYDPEDLSDPTIRKMVTRAIFWAAGKQPDDYRRQPEN